MRRKCQVVVSGKCRNKKVKNGIQDDREIVHKKKREHYGARG